MICPIVNEEETANRLNDKVDKFINNITHSVDSRRPVMIIERNSIHARPATEREIEFMTRRESSYQRQEERIHGPHHSGSKRRNIDFGTVDVRNVRSRVYEDTYQNSVNQLNLTYVERIGNPRVVAGAITKPRYMEGIDQNGVVRSRIQIRSVPIHPQPRLSTSRPAAEVIEEPVYRDGLFGRNYIEDDEYDEQQIVRNALYDENGEIAEYMLEYRLDLHMRESNAPNEDPDE